MKKKEGNSKSHPILKGFRWAVSVIIALAAFTGFVSGDFILATMVFFMALLICPIMDRALSELKISFWPRLGLFIVLIVVFGAVSPKEGAKSTQTITQGPAPTSTKQVSAPTTVPAPVRAPSREELFKQSYKNLSSNLVAIEKRVATPDGYIHYSDLSSSDLNAYREAMSKLVTLIQNDLSAGASMDKKSEEEYVAGLLKSLNTSAETAAMNERTLASIEVSASKDTWDNDANIDGVTLTIDALTNPYNYVRPHGHLTVSLYEDAGMTNSVKGRLLDTWSEDIDSNMFQIGTCGNEDRLCGFIREIRIPWKPFPSIGSFSRYYLEVHFESQGKQFEAIDTFY